MVGIRKVCMPMLHGLMVVAMGMPLARSQYQARLIWMAVPMVLIVCMLMFVIHGRMDVGVLVLLGQMQPDSQAHQQAC